MSEKNVVQSHYETTVSEEKIYSGRVFSVGLRDVVLENGETSKREIVYHNGGAGILPVDSDGNVYLVRQFRCAFDKEILEIPAGKLEKGEDPFFAAVRELEEETGFKSDSVISLGEYWPTVGYCTERVYLYVAKMLTKGETHFDSDEFISLVKMPYEEAYEKCMNGEICDGKTLLAILKAKKYL
ncbi:MAG: NUDIX hydrolase [Oscillospiraceae bacterium]|nr:NUDIX hydrolase [Oscillospiraceae bacterium]